MWRCFSFVLLFVLFSSSSWARTFTLDFNDESAQFGYQQALSQEAYGESLAGIRLLFNDDNKDTFLGSARFGVKGSPGNVPGLETSLLVSVNYSDTDDENMLALGLGLTVDYLPHTLGGLGLSTGIHYAPDIFSFADSENYVETFVGVRYAIMPNAALTLAYQYIRIDYEKFGNTRVDDSIRIGVRFDF